MPQPKATDRATRKDGKPRRPAPPQHDDERTDDEGDFMDLATRTVGRSDAAATVARHLSEKMKARRQRDEWKAAYEALAAEFPDDAVALVGPEAEAYRALQERKIDFAKLPDLLGTLENDKATLTAENLEFKARETYQEFGKASGYNVDAVAGVVRNERLHAELGDVTVDTVDAQGKKTGSKTVKTLKVRKANDPKAPLVPFDEYVNKNAAWMWPALKAKPEGQTGHQGQTGQTGQQQTRGGQPAVTVEQPSTGDGQSVDPVQARINAHRKRQQAAKSPLDFGAHAASAAGGGRRGAPVR